MSFISNRAETPRIFSPMWHTINRSEKAFTSHFSLKERQDAEITVETFPHSVSNPAYYLTAELIKVGESRNQRRIARFSRSLVRKEWWPWHDFIKITDEDWKSTTGLHIKIQHPKIPLSLTMWPHRVIPQIITEFPKNLILQLRVQLINSCAVITALREK